MSLTQLNFGSRSEMVKIQNASMSVAVPFDGLGGLHKMRCSASHIGWARGNEGGKIGEPPKNRRIPLES